MAAAKEVHKKEDIADWFYLPYWKPSVTPTPTPEEVERAGRWLVFLDEAAWGEAAVVRLIAEGRRVTVVRTGEGFRRTEEGRYEIAPGRREDYDALIKELAGAGALPDCVLHLWSLGPVVTAGEELARVPDLGFWSLLYLAQALGKNAATQRVHLGVVLSGMQPVMGEERLVPERALLLGPIKSLAQEYPSLRCVGIDVPWPAGGSLVGKLIAETTAEPARPVAAYRGAGRWVQDYEAVRLEAPAPAALPLHERGVYLITGGLGGLGLTFAEMLAREHRARLVLLGVTALPDRAAWDEWLAARGESDRISQRIRKIREIEALGSEVMVAGADVTDREQMRTLVEQATAHFGPIQGVIHTAGLAGGGMIQLKTAENARRVLAPKVEGTRSLLDALAGSPLDFVVFCSSTIAVAGGLGQVDYCAANNFLDALSHDLALTGGPRTVSINWGAWEEVGMAVAAGLTRGASTSASPEAAAGAEDIHPLLDRCVFEMADQTIYETDLSTDRHWVVREHKVLDIPTLPGTTYLELGRAAFLHHAALFEGYAPDGGVELRDVFFLSPLLLAEGKRPLRVFLEKDGDAFNFRVASLTDTGRGEPGWQPHARGRVQALSEPPARERYDIAEILARCTESTMEITGPLMSSGEGAVYWGPHWQSLQRIHIGRAEGLARIELPRGIRRGGHALRPASGASRRRHRNRRLRPGGQLPAALLSAGPGPSPSAATFLQLPVAGGGSARPQRDDLARRPDPLRRGRGAGRDQPLHHEAVQHPVGGRQAGGGPSVRRRGAFPGGGRRRGARRGFAGGSPAGGGRAERHPSSRGGGGAPPGFVPGSRGAAGRGLGQGPPRADRAGERAQPGLPVRRRGGGHGAAGGDPRAAEHPHALRAAVDRDRTAPGRGLAGNPGARQGGGQRQLLRPRRRLDPGHPAHRPVDGGRLAALARPALRAPDHRRAGQGPGGSRAVRRATAGDPRPARAARGPALAGGADRAAAEPGPASGVGGLAPGLGRTRAVPADRPGRMGSRRRSWRGGFYLPRRRGDPGPDRRDPRSPARATRGGDPGRSGENAGARHRRASGAGRGRGGRPERRPDEGRPAADGGPPRPAAGGLRPRRLDGSGGGAAPGQGAAPRRRGERRRSGASGRADGRRGRPAPGGGPSQASGELRVSRRLPRRPRGGRPPEGDGPARGRGDAFRLADRAGGGLRRRGGGDGYRLPGRAALVDRGLPVRRGGVYAVGFPRRGLSQEELDKLFA